LFWFLWVGLDDDRFLVICLSIYLCSFLWLCLSIYLWWIKIYIYKSEVCWLLSLVFIGHWWRQNNCLFWQIPGRRARYMAAHIVAYISSKLHTRWWTEFFSHTSTSEPLILPWHSPAFQNFYTMTPTRL